VRTHIEERAQSAVLPENHENRRTRRVKEHTITRLRELVGERDQDWLAHEDFSALCLEASPVGIHARVEFEHPERT
jgi:hypothetical protein